MDEQTQMDKQNPQMGPEGQPRWDYTSRRGTLVTGAVVLGLNILVLVYVILYQTFPSVREFTSGRPF